ncbi:MAG: gamma-glutamyl-gamma-aminobutyrate hydrolase family protein [Lachnospiraceae bacterium]|nr:gamma-glutamyl-gamma-aminobutyrate hydrolase family protein [Lachnospiraceae bacterium]
MFALVLVLSKGKGAKWVLLLFVWRRYMKPIRVNSYHHQAIKQKAEGVKSMAVSEDGITEAIEIPGKRFVWALQWHPEFSYRNDENSKKIFEEFVRQCKER